mmetsp:Transcript_19182/g.47748  ORF Transcript_19182/g.47748 Transcript_19182/m.47748 type:complete len:220 (+) Transcript_19182:1469-2128(+)
MISPCLSREGTIIRRANPIQVWGMVPSPAISLDVSTTMTLFSSASLLAASRTMVVFPDPGSPRINTDLFLWCIRRSISIEAFPLTFLPIRMVTPVMFRSRSLIAENLCSDPLVSSPARLSLPKLPRWEIIFSSSCCSTSLSESSQRLIRELLIQQCARRPTSSAISLRFAIGRDRSCWLSFATESLALLQRSITNLAEYTGGRMESISQTFASTASGSP